jgi:hypothetical protein
VLCSTLCVNYYADEKTDRNSERNEGDESPSDYEMFDSQVAIIYID